MPGEDAPKLLPVSYCSFGYYRLHCDRVFCIVIAGEITLLIITDEIPILLILVDYPIVITGGNTLWLLPVALLLNYYYWWHYSHVITGDITLK